MRTKKLVRALRLAECLPDLAATAATLTRAQLYTALHRSGYRWDSQTLTWYKREARP